MQIAHAADSEQINSIRGKEREFKTLLTGEEGAPDNFRLYFVRQLGAVDVPRHKHNFDQIRVCLEGGPQTAEAKGRLNGNAQLRASELARTYGFCPRHWIRLAAAGKIPGEFLAEKEEFRALRSGFSGLMSSYRCLLCPREMG